MRALKIILALAASIGIVAILPNKQVDAACDQLPGNNGLASLTVTIEETGQYAAWLRITAPAADHNRVIVQIDDQCPVVVSPAQNTNAFQWANHQGNIADAPAQFTLSPGQHTLKIAAQDTAVGVDKILLLNDLSCIPTGMGDNCLKDAAPTTPAPTVPSTPPTTPAPSTTNWLILTICTITVVATLGFLLWKYRRFVKKTIIQVEQAGVAAGTSLAHTTLTVRLLQFFRHHKLLVGVCCCIILLACVVGVVAAASRSPYEAESATLYGGAKIVDHAEASGGKYVIFEQNPPGASVPESALQQTGAAATNNTNGATGGNENGGQTTTPPPSGSDPTPTGECPAYPAFPDDNCTGWQHTGISLQTCTEDDGDEGDGHLEKANATYDGCDFTDGAVVHSPNVTIKRSRIQGVVSAHWSTDYDFQNLQLIDVEIIAATPSQIAAKNMVNESGGSAINGANMSCLRCRIHYVPTGISLGNGSTIRDSYISDVTWGPGAHQAAIGAGGNSGHNSNIIHNRLDCSRWNVNASGFQQGCSSALSLYDEPTLNNVLVQNNLFDTAGGYCTYGGGPQGTNIRYINNQFGKKYAATCGSYGAVSAFYSGNGGNVWAGNTWQDGSGAVNP